MGETHSVRSQTFLTEIFPGRSGTRTGGEVGPGRRVWRISGMVQGQPNPEGSFPCWAGACRLLPQGRGPCRMSAADAHPRQKAKAGQVAGWALCGQ